LCGTLQAIPRTRDAWLRSSSPFGTKTLSLSTDFDARSLQTDRRFFEDDDDDEDEDD
jgi:hypothetical protein